MAALQLRSRLDDSAHESVKSPFVRLLVEAFTDPPYSAFTVTDVGAMLVPS